MTAKDRFLNELLKRNGKERWVAALLLAAPPEVLSTVTVKTLRKDGKMGMNASSS
ncbi:MULTISPECIES: hypothetical protein [Paenibacillus]|uniref:Uncharacterized protein n=1 Tax=Paenibacillus aceti TaxID=1820010 RepID=A0ABQ1W9T0_9BACL|nr:hypothetical protein [Paenibacillus aceti]KHF31696.1 hypothetical protein CM49_06078 [Paenibacillus sp. P1XP2]GGG18354.1 hypothetical protein GCM10010913_45630 [Paenibacillus aceti]